MTFSTFESSYGPPRPTASSWTPVGAVDVELDALLQIAAGSIFRDSLYMVHTAESAQRADELVAEYYKGASERFRCFGVSWLGNMFAIDLSRPTDRGYEVAILEPGSGEVHLVPRGVTGFHEVELVDWADDAIGADLYADWRSIGGARPDLAGGQSVGVKVPGFLGGQYVVENLVGADLAVHWSLMGQLRQGI